MTWDEIKHFLGYFGFMILFLDAALLYELLLYGHLFI